MPISERVDVFMNPPVGLAYATPKRTDSNSAAVEDVEIEESNQRSTDIMKAYAEPTSVFNPTADHMAVTRNQSAELQIQQQQQEP